MLQKKEVSSTYDVIKNIYGVITLVWIEDETKLFPITTVLHQGSALSNLSSLAMDELTRHINIKSYVCMLSADHITLVNLEQRNARILQVDDHEIPQSYPFCCLVSTNHGEIIEDVPNRMKTEWFKPKKKTSRHLSNCKIPRKPKENYKDSHKTNNAIWVRISGYREIYQKLSISKTDMLR